MEARKPDSVIIELSELVTPVSDDGSKSDAACCKQMGTGLSMQAALQPDEALVALLPT